MKKTIYTFTLVFCSYLALAQKNKPADVAAIKAAREASNLAIAAHDVEGISKYWLPDFVQVRGNSAHLTGKDKIEATWKDIFKSNPKIVYVRNPTEVLISDDGKLAWESGRWNAINSASKGGSYSAMWKKVDGVWKLQAEMFVSL